MFQAFEKSCETFVAKHVLAYAVLLRNAHLDDMINISWDAMVADPTKRTTQPT